MGIRHVRARDRCNFEFLFEPLHFHMFECSLSNLTTPTTLHELTITKTQNIDKYEIFSKIFCLKFFLLSYLLWQGKVLQGSVTKAPPLQYFPPLNGAGLVHVLLFLFSPLPQLLSHGENTSSVDQLPPTEKFTYLYFQITRINVNIGIKTNQPSSITDLLGNG